jgi:hypothetical protein
VELLLNAIWATLALCAFLAYLRQQPHSETEQSPQAKSLIALACVLFLLFPVVSASDDLHAVPGMLEDATKRILRISGPLPQVRGNPSAPLLAVVLVLLTVIIFVALRTTLHLAIPARLADRERVPSDGRSPPSF